MGARLVFITPGLVWLGLIGLASPTYAQQSNIPGPTAVINATTTLSGGLRMTQRYTGPGSTKTMGWRAPDVITTTTDLVMPNGGGVAGYCMTTAGGVGTVATTWTLCSPWIRNSGTGIISPVVPTDTVEAGGVFTATLGGPSAGGNIGLIDNIVPLPGAVSIGLSGASRVLKLWLVDLDISGTCTGAACVGTGSLPVVDSTFLVYGSGDATKRARLEVDGLSTATDVIMTVQNIAAQTLAVQNVDNVFPTQQSSLTGFKAAISSNLGYVAGNKVEVHNAASGAHFDFRHAVTNQMRLYAPDGITLIQEWDFDGIGANNISWRGHWLPITDNQQDIGATADEIKDIHMDGNIWAATLKFLDGATLNTQTGNIIAWTAGRTIGDASVPYAGINVLDVITSTLTPTTGTGSVINNGAHLIPILDNANLLGNSTHRYADIRTVDLTVSGTCTGCGSGFLSDNGTTVSVTNTGRHFAVGTNATSLMFEVAGGNSKLGGTLLTTGDITTAAIDMNGNLSQASDGGGDIGNATGNRPASIHAITGLFVYNGASTTLRSTLSSSGMTLRNSVGTQTITAIGSSGNVVSSGSSDFASYKVSGTTGWTGTTTAGCSVISGLIMSPGC